MSDTGRITAVEVAHLYDGRIRVDIRRARVRYWQDYILAGHNTPSYKRLMRVLHALNWTRERLYNSNGFFAYHPPQVVDAPEPTA